MVGLKAPGHLTTKYNASPIWVRLFLYGTKNKMSVGVLTPFQNGKIGNSGN